MTQPNATCPACADAYDSACHWVECGGSTSGNGSAVPSGSAGEPTPTAAIVFDEDGELPKATTAWLAAALRAGETLTGLAAIAWLADVFAGETHGNYTGGTLYWRADLGTSYAVTVRRLTSEDTHG